MGPDRMERVAAAGRGRLGAVVDQEGGAAMRGQPPADLGGEGVGFGAALEDGALGGVGGKRGAGVRLGEPEGEAVAALVETHASLSPAAPRADELADREGVDELVGEQQERSLRQGVERGGVMRPGDGRALRAAERRRGLDRW
jgi:hypothetical protein